MASEVPPVVAFAACFYRLMATNDSNAAWKWSASESNHKKHTQPKTNTLSSRRDAARPGAVLLVDDHQPQFTQTGEVALLGLVGALFVHRGIPRRLAQHNKRNGRARVQDVRRDCILARVDRLGVARVFEIALEHQYGDQAVHPVVQ